MSDAFFFQMLRVSLVIGLSSIALAVASFFWEKQRFSIRWRKRLWGIFAAILLIGPFLPLPDGMLVLTVPEKAVISPLPAQAAADMEETEANQDIAHFEFPSTSEEIPGENTTRAVSEQDRPQPSPLDLFGIFKLLWIAGTTCFLLWLAGMEFWRSRKLRRWGQPVKDAELLEAYKELCGNKKRFPEIVTYPGLSSAMLVGIFRPKILIPFDGLKPEEAAYVLHHEFVHWQQHDLWLKLLAILANAIHWWNPAAWLVRRCLEQDIEWACDEIVLKDADVSQRKAYGAVLLSAASHKRKPLTTAFAGDAKTLKRRLEILLIGKKRSGAALAIFAAVGAACLLFLVSCSGTGSTMDSLPGTQNAESPPGTQDSQYTDVSLIKKRSVLVLGRTLDSFTDVIMLAEFDAEVPALHITSIPRDTSVEYKSRTVKLGYVYDAAGGGGTGQDAVKRSVAALTGVTADDTILLDTQALATLVDSIGGVTFDVPMDMNYEDSTQGLSIHLNKGKQLLDGEQAAGLVRFRRENHKSGYENGDLGRIATQQEFLRVLLEQLLQGIDKSHMMKLISIFHENVTTSLDIGDCIGLAQAAIEYKLGGQNISFATILPDSP